MGPGADNMDVFKIIKPGPANLDVGWIPILSYLPQTVYIILQHGQSLTLERIQYPGPGAQ